MSLAAPIEIAWADFLNGQKIEARSSDIIRIESPGENFEVEKCLVSLGNGPSELAKDYGRLRYQVPWYNGWRKAITELENQITGGCFMNHPQDILLMFDKLSAQRHLEAAGVPIPELIGPIENFDHLLSEMQRCGMKRVFLKPSHSSSASGVVGFQIGNRDRMLATTSAELVQNPPRIYNSLRLRNYRDPSIIRQLVDLLGNENLMAERWFPKASLNGRTYDLRVLVIAGNAKHTVVRTSQSPITNLHLGNQRGDLQLVQSDLGEQNWAEAMAVCESAAASFAKSHYIAVDLMVSSRGNRFAVAEVNAFGDLIPNIEFDGDDTYTAELRDFAQVRSLSK